MNINVDKFGFLNDESMVESMVYFRNGNDDSDGYDVVRSYLVTTNYIGSKKKCKVNVVITNNLVSVSILGKFNKHIEIANRYVIDSQDQFDFLILNSHELRKTELLKQLQVVSKEDKKEERFTVLEESFSGHCCFEYTVVETKSDGKALCECFEKEHAEIICNALNQLP